LAEEAIWLARLLLELCPNEPEIIGLLALLLYAEARAAARRTSGGDYVPLSEQDPALWNDKWLGEAEELLWKASSYRKIGRFQVEAAIQSAHVARRKTGRTDWAAILSLYDALLIFARSPVVIINRSVAIAAVRGPAEALQELDGLADEPRIRDYQPYWAAKANFYQRLGDIPNAKLAYTRAAGLSTDNAVRKFLILRKDALPGGVL
jgi:RNA polymerase sigma-70 factor (ECF subfamily)